jgi:phosphoglycerate dehydrogenase-like enzyme
MKSKRQFHLHLESFSNRPALFQINEQRWAAAARRHPILSKKIHVTIGWDGNTLNEALKTADFMINSNPPRDELAARAPNLKWIQTTGAGIESLLPLDWLPEQTVLTNNSGAHGAKAEDSCAMALLMINCRLPQVTTNQRNHIWQQIYSTPIVGKTVVIIGFGELGKAAGRAAKKLGLHIIAISRSGKKAASAHEVYSVSRLDRVLPKADFVIVTTPLTPQTRGLLNAKRLNLLPPHAGVINIGRAPVIDYEALCSKLKAGELSGAVLDVYDQEPLPSTSQIWGVPNLVILPHISCDDPRYIDQLFDRWFINFERYITGKPLRNIVDRKLGY